MCGCLTVEEYKYPGRASTNFISIKLLSLIALSLPTITAYLCIISTFFTKADVISNYSLANCPDILTEMFFSSLPPISYSIGSWEPQKQFWMFSVILHLPARMLLTIVVSQVWKEGIWRLAGFAAGCLEMIGLVCVSLFHVDSFAGFHVHAAFFSLWVAATIWGMSIIVHMQRVTRQIYHDRKTFRSWIVKILIMCAFILVTCAVSITYPLSQIYCSLTAFTAFCIGEYSIIALNAAFWVVVLIEYSKYFDGVQIVSMRAMGRDNKVAPDTPPEMLAYDHTKI